MENHAIAPPPSLTLSTALQPGTHLPGKTQWAKLYSLATTRISALDTGKKETCDVESRENCNIVQKMLISELTVHVLNMFIILNPLANGTIFSFPL